MVPSVVRMRLGHVTAASGRDRLRSLSQQALAPRADGQVAAGHIGDEPRRGAARLAAGTCGQRRA